MKNKKYISASNIDCFSFSKFIRDYDKIVIVIVVNLC